MYKATQKELGLQEEQKCLLICDGLKEQITKRVLELLYEILAHVCVPLNLDKHFKPLTSALSPSSKVSLNGASKRGIQIRSENKWVQGKVFMRWKWTFNFQG